MLERKTCILLLEPYILSTDPPVFSILGGDGGVEGPMGAWAAAGLGRGPEAERAAPVVAVGYFLRRFRHDMRTICAHAEAN